MGGVVLWGTASWTLSQCERNILKSTQSKMARKVLACGRRPDEEYISWIRRATKNAKIALLLAGVKAWAQRHYMSKWLWCGHVARMPPDRWAKKLSLHTSIFADDPAWHRPVQARAGTQRRWENDVQIFLTSTGHGNWVEAAADRNAWNAGAEAFVSFFR